MDQQCSERSQAWLKNASAFRIRSAGLSGAIQHVVGMQGSQLIVAVNKDASAPVFDVATYGVVADLFEFLPAFVKCIRQERE